MRRIGMTNPPYILEHLKEIADVLSHPCVYSFLHVPVQSGSDAVWSAMNREYTSSEFRKVVDTLTELVPEMHIATDIICGFPGESDEDFARTINLVKEYEFPRLHISQFYPRPGTPAARMKKVPSTIVKNRSRELTSLFESFTPYSELEGKVARIWITEIATDGVHLVGHTKGYVQVLVVGPESMLGSSAIVKITSVRRWSVFGEVLKTLTIGQIRSSEKQTTEEKDLSTPCLNTDEDCGCSGKTESCCCGLNICNTQMKTLEESIISPPENELGTEDHNNRKLVGWLLRKRRNQSQKISENKSVLESKGNELALDNKLGWGAIDNALVGGVVLSFLIILALFTYLGSNNSSSK